MSTLGPDGRIDPSRGVIVTCVGRKGSGKSVMGLTLFRSYPGDRLVIDVAGDDGPVGEDVWEIRGTHEEIPSKWPEWRRDGDRPMTLRYVPDPGSKTYLEDMDAAMGLAVSRGECCVLVHEMGQLCPAGRTPPNTKRALGQGRHNGATTQIYCGPRSQGIDPLVLQQSDLVYVFELKNRDDRVTIAENIGWDRRQFDDLVNNLPQFWHLRYDQNIPPPEPGQPDPRLVRHSPLPPNVVASTLRWAQGYRPRSREDATA